MSFSLKQLVATVAPTLATLIGGPMAGMAVKAIADAAGCDNTPDAVTAALTGATPELLAKVKQADQDFISKMKSLDVDLTKIAADDRDSARKASVAGGTLWPLFWLSILLVTVTLGAEIYVLLDGYPKAVPEVVVGRILGLCDSVTMIVLSFWYGTTKGSQAKDDTIKALAQ